MTAPLTVDARGMRCPWPALRLARAIRDLPAGGRIRLLADDPAAPREVAALAADRGWQILAIAGDVIEVSPMPGPGRLGAA